MKLSVATRKNSSNNNNNYASIKRMYDSKSNTRTGSSSIITPLCKNLASPFSKMIKSSEMQFLMSQKSPLHGMFKGAG